MTGLINKLSDRGYKVTPQRRIILQVLSDSHRHLSAEEIADEVKQIEPGISVATVYRNLNLLVDISMVSRLDLHEGPVRYELNRGHNHHLVCLGCGLAVKLDVCPMQGEVQKIIDQEGFQVDSHHFEITGYCRDCNLRTTSIDISD